jgi:hypothetical protein
MPNRLLFLTKSMEVPMKTISLGKPRNNHAPVHHCSNRCCTTDLAVLREQNPGLAREILVEKLERHFPVSYIENDIGGSPEYCSPEQARELLGG